MVRQPYVFDVQDLQPDTAVDLGMLPSGALHRGLYALERFAYRHAAAVSTLTEAMRARITAKGVPGDKVVKAGLWAAPDLLALPSGRVDDGIRAELGLGDGFIALHVGNMGVKQGLNVIVDAARRAARRDVRYVLVGDGAMRRALEDRVRRERLDNVTIIPLLPRDRFQRLLAAADVALVTQQRVVSDVVFPSKVLTLMAAARPVIASVAERSEIAAVIREAGAGMVVPPEDPVTLAAAVEQLCADAAARTAAGDAGRDYVVRFHSRSAALGRFAREVEQHAASLAGVTVTTA